MVGFIIMKRGLCVSIVAPPSTTTSPRPVAERPECQSLPHKPLKAYLIFRSRLNGALLPRWHLQPNREPSCRVSESSLLLTLRWRGESGANSSLKCGFRRLGTTGNSEAVMDDKRSRKGLFRGSKTAEFQSFPLAASAVI